MGSSVILAEITELIGAEHILSSRVINNIVKDEIFLGKKISQEITRKS